jgi:CubicO group peptidase (beta-lactamase class C family)
MKNILHLLALLSLSAHAQFSQTVADSLLSRLQREEGFGGNVLIAVKGNIIYQRSLGVSDAGTGRLLRQDAIFNLASVSKTFTAVAIMQLARNGKLHLTDSLQRYFPDLPYHGITIYHLLTHTSGLEDYMADPIRNALSSSPDDAEIERVYARVHVSPRFAPGSNWSYSNTNFILLALIIEKVSGMTYTAYLKRHIFRPAQMKHSYVLAKNIAPADAPLLVHRYYYPDMLAVHPVNVDSIPMGRMESALNLNVYGDGGIFSTAGDLFLFHQALQKGRLLSLKSQAQLYMSTVLSDQHRYEAGNANPDYKSGYGLGWLVANDSSQGKVVWHSGAIPGLLTFFMRNITRDQCVVVLNNHWYRGTYHLGGSLLNLLNDRRLQLLPPSLARTIGQAYTLYGPDTALHMLTAMKNNKAYHIGFLEMNQLGYDLLAKNDTRCAIAVLTINTDTYPDSGDAWDSLAEAYYKAGDKATAVADYERSISLNPNNENGKKMLSKIKAETGRSQ